MTAPHQLIWFRSDLRVSDHPALFHGCQKGAGIAIYTLFPRQWQNHGDSPNKIWFWMQNLKALSLELEKKNIPLIVLELQGYSDAPATLLTLAQQLKCQGIWLNNEHGINEEMRDAEVESAFLEEGFECHRFTSQTIVKPGALLNKQTGFFKVFTPFKKALYQKISLQGLQPLPAPKKQSSPEIPDFDTPDYPERFQPSATGIDKRWPAGEKAARKILNTFIEEQSFYYKENRDYPAVNGTSDLSPYLVAGVISLREAFYTAAIANEGEFDTGNPGLCCWMSELIWREFYKHILHGFPRVSKHMAFQEETEKLSWSTNAKHLKAWQQGKTGVPIVDAAMKQLVQTGWMHNRLRMVTAMYLSKNLFIDWRLGEAFFMEHLIDGDLSANNGGWQWSASTGTDAAPYFRMFNPVSQSEKFDAKGVFIRQWLPELADLHDKEIHAPWKAKTSVAGYPEPLVDLALSRQKVLAAFKSLK